MLNKKNVSIYNSNSMRPLKKAQIDWVASQLGVQFSSDFYDLIKYLVMNIFHRLIFLAFIFDGNLVF